MHTTCAIPEMETVPGMAELANRQKHSQRFPARQ
jgi:hypothetical protein